MYLQADNTIGGFIRAAAIKPASTNHSALLPALQGTMMVPNLQISPSDLRYYRPVPQMLFLLVLHLIIRGE
jgi:hypothetical protein